VVTIVAAGWSRVIDRVPPFEPGHIAASQKVANLGGRQGRRCGAWQAVEAIRVAIAAVLEVPANMFDVEV
jgi:hypothetical protein